MMRKFLIRFVLFLIFYIPVTLALGRFYEKLNGIGINLFGFGTVFSFFFFAVLLFAAGALVAAFPAAIVNRKTIAAASVILVANYIHASFFLPELEYFAGVGDCGLSRDIEPDFKGFNLVLVSLDTLRADHLRSYGYERETSPNCDSLFSRSFAFMNAFSAAPSTLPSHATIMTGLQPGVHRANFSRRNPLPSSAVTLAEILNREGYRTGSFNGGGQIDAAFGLDQGFEVYNDDAGGFSEIWPRARQWLDFYADRKFFLFLHSYDIHLPYKPPQPFNTMFYPEYSGDIGDAIKVRMIENVNAGMIDMSEDDIKHVEALYDGGIRYTDRYISKIEEFLDSKGVANRTIIVVLSDHGEEFNEHGYVAWHSHTLYDELLHVPLIIYIPGAGPGIVNEKVGIVGLMPTLLDILGVYGGEYEMNGSSFARIIAGDGQCDTKSSVLLAEKESRNGIESSIAGKLESAMAGKWKYIASVPENRILRSTRFAAGSFIYASRELYDIDTDPLEKENIVSKNYRLARSLEKMLYRLDDENSNIALEQDGGAVELDKQKKQRIRDLGYIE